MSLINKFITKANEIANKNPFILNTIKKVISLCPCLEEKICKTIDRENIKKITEKTGKELLLSKTGQEIFDIISSSKFEKKAKDKQEIDYILTSIDNLFLNKKIDKQTALHELSNIISQEYDEIILKNIAQRTAEYLYDREDNYIFIELSELAKKDAKTGIQRVSKNVLKLLPKISKKTCIPIYSDKKTYGFKNSAKLTEDKQKKDEEYI